MDEKQYRKLVHCFFVVRDILFQVLTEKGQVKKDAEEIAAKIAEVNKKRIAELRNEVNAPTLDIVFKSKLIRQGMDQVVKTALDNHVDMRYLLGSCLNLVFIPASSHKLVLLMEGELGAKGDARLAMIEKAKLLHRNPRRTVQARF